MEKEFSYCIGRPWYPDDPNSSICVYTYGVAVFHGNKEDAENMRKFIEGRASDGHKYNIYKLVKVDGA